MPMSEADVQVMVQVLSLLAGIAGIAAFALDAVNAARQREPDCAGSRFGAGALLIAAVAALIAMRTRVTGYEHLQSIARNAKTVLAREGTVRGHLFAHWSRQYGSYRRILKWPAAPLTVVVGKRGNGKTFNTRLMVTELAERVERRRRPRLVPVWVDASKTETVEEITIDLVAQHVSAAAAPGNSEDAEFFAGCMRPGHRRIRWLIMIDSADDLPFGSEHEDREAALLAYLDRAREFARSRRHVRVVAIMYEAPRDLPTDIPVFETAAMEPHQIRQFVDPSSQPELVDRLRFDATLIPIGQRPMLLRTLGALADGPPVTGGRFELMSRIVSAHLAPVVADEEQRRAVEYTASAMAWQIADTKREHVDASADDADAVEVLVAAGLVRVVHGRVRFTNGMFGVYFAARLLLTGDRRPDVRWALESDYRWEVVLTALQSGDREVRARTVDDALSLLHEEKLADPSLPNALTITDPRSVGPGGVRWPNQAGEAMRLLRHGLATTPGLVLGEPAVTERVDRMITATMAGGTDSGKVRALWLLPLASPDTALDVARLVIADHEDPSLVKPLLEELSWLPDVTARLNPRLLAAEFFRGGYKHMMNTLAYSPPSAREPESLAWRMRNVVRVGQATVLCVMALSLLWMIANLPGYGLVPAWLIAGGFLVDRGIREESSPRLLGEFCGFALLFLSGLGALVGIGLSAMAAWRLFAGDVLPAIGLAVSAYVLTWPVTMLLTVLLSRQVRPVDWLVPHVLLIQQALVPVVTEAVHAARANPAIHSVLVTPYTLISVLTAVLCVVLTGYDLTVLPDTVETVIDIALVLAAVVLATLPVVRLTLRLTANRRERKAMLFNVGLAKDIDDDWMLEMIDTAALAGPERVSWFLRDLSQMDSTKLAKAATVIGDLDAALEFTRKVLPAMPKGTRPGAQWRIPAVVIKSVLAGPFAHPGFHTWMVQFDQRHPGVLSWLATNHRHTVTDLVYLASYADQER